eukprot:3149449-Pyramimonas_sp.AAC.2
MVTTTRQLLLATKRVVLRRRSVPAGSHLSMPETRSSLPGVYFAGDWVRQGPEAAYGQRGLSQEKALVTGDAGLFYPILLF